MLHAKDSIAVFYWSNADGPLDVRVYGRFMKDGLVIHGVLLENIYPRGKPRLSALPRPLDLVPVVVAEVRKGLLNGGQIKITTPAGRPSIAAWGGSIGKPGRVPNQCTRGWRVEWRPRGRPRRTKFFRDANDFRDTCVTLIKDIDRRSPGHELGKELFAELLDLHLYKHPLVEDNPRKPETAHKAFQRYCLRYKYSFEELLRLARS